MKYAGFFIRLISTFTDLFLIVIPIVIFYIYLIPGLKEQFINGFLNNDSLLLTFQILVNTTVGVSIISMLYFWNGATFGKKLMNIRIVKKNGDKLTFIDAVRHYLSTMIYFIPFVFIISIILVFIRKDRRTLHDFLAGTVVIHNQNDKDE